MTKRYFLFAIILMIVAFTLIALTFYIKNSKAKAVPASVATEAPQFNVTGLVPFDQWKLNK